MGIFRQQSLLNGYLNSDGVRQLRRDLPNDTAVWVAVRQTAALRGPIQIATRIENNITDRVSTVATAAEIMQRTVLQLLGQDAGVLAFVDQFGQVLPHPVQGVFRARLARVARDGEVRVDGHPESIR